MEEHQFHLQKILKKLPKSKVIIKKNEIVVVCSATSGTTDDLIEISESIKKENKSKAEQLASKITNRHKKLAKQTIKKSDVRKKLLKT